MAALGFAESLHQESKKLKQTIVYRAHKIIIRNALDFCKNPCEISNLALCCISHCYDIYCVMNMCNSSGMEWGRSASQLAVMIIFIGSAQKTLAILCSRPCMYFLGLPFSLHIYSVAVNGGI